MKKALKFPPSLSSTSSPITHPLNTNATQHTRPRHAKRNLLSAASSRAAEQDNTFLSSSETPQKDATAHTHHAFLAETRETSATPPQARAQKQQLADVSKVLTYSHPPAYHDTGIKFKSIYIIPAQFSQRGEGVL